MSAELDRIRTSISALDISERYLLAELILRDIRTSHPDRVKAEYFREQQAEIDSIRDGERHRKASKEATRAAG